MEQYVTNNVPDDDDDDWDDDTNDNDSDGTSESDSSDNRSHSSAGSAMVNIVNKLLSESRLNCRFSLALLISMFTSFYRAMKCSTEWGYAVVL